MQAASMIDPPPSPAPFSLLLASEQQLPVMFCQLQHRWASSHDLGIQVLTLMQQVWVE